MKHTIEGFSQEYATTLKKEVKKNKDNTKTIQIDCTDLVILRWFVDFYPRMKKVEIDGLEYAWLTHSKLVEDLPLLDISQRAFIERMQKLVEFNILTYKFVNNKGGHSYYGFGENYINLINTNNETTIRSNVGGIYVQTYSKDNTIIDIKLNNNKKEKESHSFDDIINNYTENETLRDALIEFVKMRKTVRKPVTSHALELLLTGKDGLFKLTGGDDVMAVEIVNQSIKNSWLAFYQLKTQKATKQQESIVDRIMRL